MNLAFHPVAGFPLYISRSAFSRLIYSCDMAQQYQLQYGPILGEKATWKF